MLRARILIYFTTDLQTVIYYSTDYSKTDPFLKFKHNIETKLPLSLHWKDVVSNVSTNYLTDVDSKPKPSFDVDSTFLHKQSGIYFLKPQASVAQLDAPSDWRPGGRGFTPRRGRQHSFVEIDHEIFSTVILSLPLIQEGQLSVSGERMCTILVNRLED